MSDLARWKVHGPVRTLRSEFAEWDLTTEAWQAPRSYSLTSFLADGRISESEAHNPDGSISRSACLYDEAGRLSEMRFRMNEGPAGRTVYAYDDSEDPIRIRHIAPDGTATDSEVYRYEPDGRRTKIYTIPKLPANTGFGYSIEGTELSYDAADAATAETIYDEGGRPSEVLFLDAARRVLRNVTFERDSAGRLLRVKLHLAGENPFSELAADAPPPNDEMAAAFAALLAPSQVMSSTTYAYDEEGHVVERITQMGGLLESRTTFRYDDRQNPIEETTEEIQREMEIDAEGKPRYVRERTHRHDVKFEYVYDPQGNWTERVVWSRLEPNPNFQPSNIERREIMYYPE